MELFRPVGEKELELIKQAGWRSFPPRLPEQPIFYPVLNARYAGEIAGRWNTKDANSGFKGMLQDLWLKMNTYPVLSRIRLARLITWNIGYQRRSLLSLTVILWVRLK